MQISVVIPVYNGALFLAEALASVLAQTHAPNEIFVVDDGSVDESADIARSISGVTLLRQNNGGPGAARNLGIRQARGDAIAFLDQDDRWHADKLARQVAVLETEPELVFVLAHMNVVPDRRGAPDWVQAAYFGKHPGYVPSALLARRAAFEHIGLFDETLRVSSDVAWLGRANALGVAYRMLPEILVERTLHENNQSRGRADMRRDTLAALRSVIRLRRTLDSQGHSE